MIIPEGTIARAKPVIFIPVGRNKRATLVHSSLFGFSSSVHPPDSLGVSSRYWFSVGPEELFPFCHHCLLAPGHRLLYCVPLEDK